jgi:flagellar basal-body rod protein FlgF
MQNNIYAPLSGAIAQERLLEVIANNLANTNTTGFKGDAVTFTLIEPEPEKMYKDPLPPANYKADMEMFFPLKGNDHAYAGVANVSRDMTQGPALTTHNPTDLMIEGEGFLTVQTVDGQRLTRSGALELGPNGALVTKSGDPVLGEKGNIFLRAGAFQVNDRGEIYQDGQLVDKLLVQTVADPKTLERAGNNYFFHGGRPEDLKQVAHPRMRQGFLEGSNVNAIKSLTSMIVAHRCYEAYQKNVQNFDRMMERSSNTIGELRA